MNAARAGADRFIGRLILICGRQRSEAALSSDRGEGGSAARGLAPAARYTMGQSVGAPRQTAADQDSTTEPAATVPSVPDAIAAAAGTDCAKPTVRL